MWMNILDEIVAHKRKEVEERKELFPIRRLERSIYFGTEPVSLRKYITREDKIGLIAEIKRKSPSRGVINQHVSVERTSIGYMQAGASGLSVLTDGHYFGGKNEDLEMARKFNFCPILRKDFMIDEYQIVEAKSIGADVILLIAAVLEPAQIKTFASLARSMGMEVLLEVHNEKELIDSLGEGIDLVGVNNRDLTRFETDITTSKSLASQIPDEFVKVSESGLDNAEVIVDLMEHGYQGFLIGGYFMQFGRPDVACRELVRKVRQLQKEKGLRNEA